MRGSTVELFQQNEKQEILYPKHRKKKHCKIQYKALFCNLSLVEKLDNELLENTTKF